jgi:hypothetical protein
MALFDLRICWNCRNLWVEDDHQQEDVDRCPTCGAHAASKPCRDRYAADAAEAGAIEDGITWDETGEQILWDESGDPIKWQ